MKRLAPLLLFLLLLLQSGCATATKPGKRPVFSRLEAFGGLSFHYGFVVAAPDGHVLEAHEADYYFTTASSLKLFHFPFLSQIYQDSLYLSTRFRVQNQGGDGPNGPFTLHIYGYGDPLLKLDELKTVATQVKKDYLSISHIVLHVLPYDTLEYWGKGWMYDDEPAYFQSLLNAFPINLNLAQVQWKKKGPDETITVTPPVMPVVRFDTGFTLLARNAQNQVVCYRPQDDTKPIDITAWLSYRNPTGINMALLRELFGAPTIEMKVETDMKSSPADYIIRHKHEELFKEILWNSDNICTEQTMRYLSMMRGNAVGSIDAALALERKDNEAAGLDVSYKVADGSGLSRYNLVSPKNMLDQLMRARELGHDPLKVLPGYGEHGTLKNYPKLPQGYRFLAKGGSMSGIHSIAGYIYKGDEFRGYLVLFINNTVLPWDKRRDFEFQFIQETIAKYFK